MIDKVAYQQAKRARELAEMRARVRVNILVIEEEKAQARIRMRALAEQAEARRRAERVERRRIDAIDMRDPAHPLYRVVTANLLGGREFDETEIKALDPCGRFEQFKNRIGQTFSLDIKRAVALGATFNDLSWVAASLARYSPEAKERYALWREKCQGRGQQVQFQLLIEAFSDESYVPTSL